MHTLAVATIVVAAVTLAFNLVFWLKSLRGFRIWKGAARLASEPSEWPRAHVFVCLKGHLPRLAATVEALERQDYPGEFRVTFVTESDPTSDVAARELLPLLPGTRRSDHKVSGRVVDSTLRCGQKNFNLLAGIAHANERYGPLEVYAFCDGDLEVSSHWLREMVRPIAMRSSEASTSFHYTHSAEGRVVGALHGLAETCQSLAALVVKGATWGGSMAISATVFHRHGLDRIWSRTVVDDMTMSRLLKKSRLRVAPIAEFLVKSRSDLTSYRSFVRWLGRQFFFVKIYLPSLYWLLWTKMALNVTTLWLATFHITYRIVQGDWVVSPLVGGAAVFVSAAMLGSFVLYWHAMPERPATRDWLGATILVPGVSLLACADATLRRRRLIWSDLTYFVERDGRVARIAESRRQAPLTVV